LGFTATEVGANYSTPCREIQCHAIEGTLIRADHRMQGKLDEKKTRGKVEISQAQIIG
jgi:hypothetical protein